MQSIRGFLKRPSFVIAVFAAILAFTVPAFAEDIVVVGNTRGDAEMIRSYFAGSSPAEVQQGVEALRNSGRFSSVTATREKGRVVVRVSESNLINRVAFEGNSKVKSEVLQSEMRTQVAWGFQPCDR